MLVIFGNFTMETNRWIARLLLYQCNARRIVDAVRCCCCCSITEGGGESDAGDKTSRQERRDSRMSQHRRCYCQITQDVPSPSDRQVSSRLCWNQLTTTTMYALLSSGLQFRLAFSFYKLYLNNARRAKALGRDCTISYYWKCKSGFSVWLAYVSMHSGPA